MKKNRIERVWIEKQVDEYPDTSFVGEYTDKDEEWNICRHCGEYLRIANTPNRRAEEIGYLINDLEAEDTISADKQITQLNTELTSLELHECPNSTRKYNYFKPYAGGEQEGTEAYQEYGKQDFERMERLNSNDWCFIGVIAKAEIVTTNNTIQVIRSGGLWGVESDSDQTCLDEIKQDELASLNAELKSLGFGDRAIKKAFQNVEEKE